MKYEDFIKWLEIKANKYERPFSWHDCIEQLIVEFRTEWTKEGSHG